MDEERSDLRQGAGERGPHVGSKRLIAYHQGTLSAPQRARVQEHLSLCPRCTGMLRELRDFEAAAAGGEAGPEALRREAWDALVRSLPAKAPIVRPIAGVPRRERRRRWRLQILAAAALVLAAVGLTLWAAGTVVRGRQRLTQLEERLEEREAALAAARRSLATAERQLAAARGRVQALEREQRDGRSQRPASREDELAAEVAELTAALAELRRTTQAPDRRDQLAGRQIEVAIAPRFVLRGEAAPDGGFLRAGGVANPVRATVPEGRFSVVLSAPDRPAYDHYRLELVDRAGRMLWRGHRPARSFLGDAGTSVSISGLGPGLYRLRIEGVRPNGADLLAEYLLELLL